jgi:hypothetical protein
VDEQVLEHLVDHDLSFAYLGVEHAVFVHLEVTPVRGV